MTTLYKAKPLARPFHALASLAKSAFRALVKAVLSWRNRRMVASMLDFDDRMLADIGLTRGDVAASLSTPALGDPSSQLAGLAHERRYALRAQARERLAKAPAEAPAAYAIAAE